MHYRRRLRSRIIVSFLLLGFGLTASFAVATILLRNRLEGSLVDTWLQSEARNFMQFKRANRAPDAVFKFSRLIEAFAYRPDSEKIPFGWRDLPRGIYGLHEYDDSGELREYKLAVHRAPDMVTFMRYDYTQEALTQRQMLYTLVAAVFLFTGLAWLIGLWSSSRVISPLTDLARRVEGLSSRENPDKLAPGERSGLIHLQSCVYSLSCRAIAIARLISACCVDLLPPMSRRMIVLPLIV